MSLVEHKSNDQEHNFARLRLDQLWRLLNRNLDKPITWDEQVARKVPFYTSYTFQTTTEKRTSEAAEVARIRYFAVFRMIEDLKGLGYGTNAEEVLLNATSLSVGSNPENF